MPKELTKEYFSHDYGTRHKKRLAALIKEKKMRGYGLFWVIVEMLHEDSTKWMELNDLTYIAIGAQSGEPVAYVRQFVEACISRYGVFHVEGDKFTTERVLRNIDLRLEIKEQKSRAGRASAEKRKQNSTPVEQPLTGDEHKSTPVQQNSTKESKVKERKGNIETVVVKDIWYEMFRRAAGPQINDDELMLEIGKFRNKYPNQHPNQAGALINTWVSRIGNDDARPSESSEKRMVI